MQETGEGPDGRPRCRWCLGDPAMLAYHDTEWGFPATGDTILFEKLALESFQSGLSWRTILAKRDNFRAAFRGFDIPRVAAFGDADVARLLADAGIIRHRGKIEAMIGNARRAVTLIETEGSLAAYLWRFAPTRTASSRSPTPTSEAIALSKDLKRRGWSFVGPTTVHAFMQAVGMIDDHAAGCVVRAAAERARDRFVPPGSAVPRRPEPARPA